MEVDVMGLGSSRVASGNPAFVFNTIGGYVNAFNAAS